MGWARRLNDMLVGCGRGVGTRGSRYSGVARVGLSGGQATGWVSDTGTMCKMSGGVGGSLVLALTTGGEAGSTSESVSYDWSMGSSVSGVNQGATGGGSMTVGGADFGTSRCALAGSWEGCEGLCGCARLRAPESESSDAAGS